MRLLLLFLLLGCAHKIKKEFWEDVGYKCPPQECLEEQMHVYDKEEMRCKCIKK